MFVDASALTAMLVDERDGYELLARMQNYTPRVTSPLAVWEAVLAVARVLGLEVKAAEIAVEEFLALTGVSVLPVPAEARSLADRRLHALRQGTPSRRAEFWGLFCLRVRKTRPGAAALQGR